MVKPIPSRFNPDLLARESTQFCVNLPLSQFSRLRDLVLDDSVEFSALFRFSRRRHTVMISGSLKTEFRLQCQRCLEPTQLAIEEPFEFAFAKTADAAQDMPEGYDPVVLDENGQIHVVDLFEDELILHLPTVARHAVESECDVELIRDETALEEQTPNEAKKRKNPFDVLKNLDLH